MSCPSLYLLKRCESPDSHTLSREPYRRFARYSNLRVRVCGENFRTSVR
jgi:hypothetical protein